jgi:hypothetical protein
MRKDEEKKSKEKWVTKTNFKNYIGISTSRKMDHLPNVMNLVPFKDSPLNYCFRVVNKNRWVGNKTFI